MYGISSITNLDKLQLPSIILILEINNCVRSPTQKLLFILLGLRLGYVGD